MLFHCDVVMYVVSSRRITLHFSLSQSLCYQIVSMVLGIALWLQAHTMPYEHGYMNWLEFLSLITCTVTIYFSLFFTDAFKEGALMIVTVLVVLLNVVTIAIFVGAMIKASWHAMLQKLKLCSKVCVPKVLYSVIYEADILHAFINFSEHYGMASQLVHHHCKSWLKISYHTDQCFLSQFYK